MPDISILERNGVSIDEIQHLLDQMQSVEAVAAHLNVHPRTVTRFIKGKLYRQYCWKKTAHNRPQDIDTHSQE